MATRQTVDIERHFPIGPYFSRQPEDWRQHVQELRLATNAPGRAWDMEIVHQIENEQAALWGGMAGHAWVEMQALLDHIFKPLEDLLLGAIPAGSGGRVLDVGCGTGSTTLAMARLLGADGHCIGIDVSEPMIAAARAEREHSPAGFIHADAQIHVLEPASFDLIISRYRNRIHAILDASGWTGIDIRPIDVACAFPEQDLVRYLTRLGPLGRILHEVDEPTRGQVTETVRAAFDPYVHGTEVRFDAACWLVTARAEAVAHVRASAH